MDDVAAHGTSDQANGKYSPNYLLDFVIDKLNLKNDAALARTLGITPPALSPYPTWKVSYRSDPLDCHA
jgi:hypothetical protein